MPQPIYSGGKKAHSVMVVGNDDGVGIIKVLKSWSDKFGDKGYFYIPWAGHGLLWSYLELTKGHPLQDFYSGLLIKIDSRPQ